MALLKDSVVTWGLSLDAVRALTRQICQPSCPFA